ncbi:hypothetical protein PILCRDRAFT_815663 [Piloderma croceum F 1598]|uniref:Mid2 domain-containing protein n=1 Tax=Piloderma croceum (strain F 1598) TaxID=765440 RepID=A0A0C3BL80_PILCF|nr:hypothetical protein PILCRDRAFT_815663 [Piloderma croceum F 1598]
MSLKVLTIFGIAAKLIQVAVLPVAQAQTSLATCLPEFGWMNNSLHQSPCVVGAYMLGVCNSGEFTVLPLAPSHHYTGPTAGQANPCQCSTVVYSLISACGACQNRTVEAWSAWQTNCSVVYPQQFPGTIPSVTRVPAWAYLDVVKSDAFNATAAKADRSAPESTGAGPKPTGSFSTTTTSSPTPTPSISGGNDSGTNGSNTTGGDSSSATTSKKSPAGAIAGAVIGVLGGLAIIATLVFFFIRRRRAKTAPSATYAYNAHSDAALNASPPMSQHSHNPLPRLYDPSDPSTFPKTPAGPTVQTANIASPQQYQSNQYSGFPEL